MSHDATPDANPPAPADAALKPAQIRALAALLLGRPITEAARAAGVARETVHRWLRQPAFAAEVRSGRAALLAGVQGDLLALADTALAGLWAALDPARPVPDAVRLRAVLAVLRAIGADRPATAGPGPTRPPAR